MPESWHRSKPPRHRWSSMTDELFLPEVVSLDVGGDLPVEHRGAWLGPNDLACGLQPLHRAESAGTRNTSVGMPTCGKCKAEGMSVDHIRGCYAGVSGARPEPEAAVEPEPKPAAIEQGPGSGSRHEDRPWSRPHHAGAVPSGSKRRSGGPRGGGGRRKGGSGAKSALPPSPGYVPPGSGTARPPGMPERAIGDRCEQCGAWIPSGAVHDCS